jgi:hypothetical protein
LFALAWVFVVLGAIGVALPLLPTTPFILLAAFCFSKSSERFHQRLLEHKLFGQIISDWQRHGVIRLKTKWVSTVTMLVMVSYPLVFVVHSQMVRAAVLLCIVGVLAFIWSRPHIQNLN